MKKDINTIIKDYCNWFNHILKIELQKNFRNKQPKIIYDSVKYALLNNGKRIRPLLLTKTGELFGLDKKYSMFCALGIEMLHTYSLVHDDLPALDNDDYRRGRLTVHLKYNEPIAVLAGDALLTMAFEYFLKTNYKIIKPCNLLNALNLLSKKSGIDGMIAGQASDIENENKKPTRQKIKFIHSHKTVDLLVASVKIGGILADADESELLIMENFAKNFGYAFQISDDILNITGSSKKMGKGVGTDAEKGKMTYIRLFGLEKTKKLCYDYIEKAKRSISQLKNKNIDIYLDLADYLIKRDR